MSARAGQPPRVAKSEAELLHLARTVVDHRGQRFSVVLRQTHVPIETIGPTAMVLLQQTLARGLGMALMRAGGWQRRRSLDAAGLPARGRLWERHPTLPPLRLSAASFRLLTWMHAENVTRPKRALAHEPSEDGHAASMADELLRMLAAERIVEAGGRLRQPAFMRSPLCQLAFPDHMIDTTRASGLPEIDFGPLVTGEGAVLLEAIQPWLAARWVEMERQKGGIEDLDEMIQLGGAQSQVLRGLFAAIDAAEPARRDLASFVAEAGQTLLDPSGPLAALHAQDRRWWTRSLEMRASLSARQRAFTASAAFLRALGVLGDWLTQAGLVAHFDEDYDAAQLLLSEWRFLHARAPELDGDTQPASLLERARTLTAAIESLHSLGAQPS
ncbi:hypothetical protein G6O69_21185 [Pseudenhygromyxa sp. WMMC2535]|uniref:hypothetical protein n=1 Tax=Pseudenhygromyxa sp. WMMC2535 TaxID=2712867 RepID=UPI001557D48E|nr:hypothetical protein [Pseudenhygromyxa sp. WMMC2535]NVB40367.1 hypothetical protein [Pseudenhygromyxa sp. WMMC2535]